MAHNKDNDAGVLDLSNKKFKVECRMYVWEEGVGDFKWNPSEITITNTHNNARLVLRTEQKDTLLWNYAFLYLKETTECGSQIDIIRVIGEDNGEASPPIDWNSSNNSKTFMMQYMVYIKDFLKKQSERHPELIWKDNRDQLWKQTNDEKHHTIITPVSPVTSASGATLKPATLKPEESKFGFVLPSA
jgi:hypothetical protein